MITFISAKKIEQYLPNGIDTCMLGVLQKAPAHAPAISFIRDPSGGNIPICQSSFDGIQVSKFLSNLYSAMNLSERHTY